MPDAQTSPTFSISTEEFLSGLSPRAVTFVAEADEIRKRHEGEASIPPEALFSGCHKLAQAFASCSYHGYFPEGKPPISVAASAIYLLFAVFSDIPPKEEKTSIDAFNRGSFDRLQDWTIDMARLGAVPQDSPHVLQDVLSQMRNLSSETLHAISDDGNSLIVPSKTLHPEKAAIMSENCIMALISDCQIGPFAVDISERVQCSTNETATLVESVLSGYDAFVPQSDKVAAAKVVERARLQERQPEVPVHPAPAPSPDRPRQAGAL